MIVEIGEYTQINNGESTWEALQLTIDGEPYSIDKELLLALSGYWLVDHLKSITPN